MPSQSLETMISSLMAKEKQIGEKDIPLENELDAKNKTGKKREEKVKLTKNT
jgi:hypothetical protein